MLWLISEQSHVAAWRSSSIDYYGRRRHQPHGSPIPDPPNVTHHYRPSLIIVRWYYLVLALYLDKTHEHTSHGT